MSQLCRHQRGQTFPQSFRSFCLPAVWKVLFDTHTMTISSTTPTCLQFQPLAFRSGLPNGHLAHEVYPAGELGAVCVLRTCVSEAPPVTKSVSGPWILCPIHRWMSTPFAKDSIAKSVVLNPLNSDRTSHVAARCSWCASSGKTCHSWWN